MVIYRNEELDKEEQDFLKKIINNGTKWNLDFEYLEHKVSIYGATGSQSKTVKVTGEGLYIQFDMTDQGNIDEIIECAKSHVDEYIEDYKEEMELLN